MTNVNNVSSSGFDDAEEALTEALAQERAAADHTQGERFWSRVLASRNTALTIAGVAIFVFFSLATQTFLTEFSLLNMIRSISLIGIVAVGMTFLMISGEIDLSVGSVFGFLTVVLGVLVVRESFNIWLASLLVIGLGALIGTGIGFFATVLGIPSLIVTLATLSIFRSGALIVSQQQPWNTDGVGLFYEITGGYIGGRIPWLIPWMLAVMFIGGVVLSKTILGYHIYATGGNLEAARNAGINTKRVKLFCFILTSALCGLIAPLFFGYLHTAAPITGTGLEFRVIGAVLVGGVALTGGRGSIYGVFVGAVIIGMITTGLVQMGLSQHYGDVATGLLILVTGTLDLFVRHLAARSLGMLEN